MKQIQNTKQNHELQSFVRYYPEARSLKRKFYLHIGHTNSGKTYQALHAFLSAEKAVYLCPLRILAYEIYGQALKHDVSCSMITGEEVLVSEGATHFSCTIEMLSLSERYDVAVIDEAQMLADNKRGSTWTTAICGVLAKEVHVCASPDALSILQKLIDFCGDTYEIIRHQRTTPLVCDMSPFAFPESVERGDSLIVFSKRSVLAVAAELQRKGWKVSILYGALPYEARRSEADRFLSGDTDVVVATDAIGMGVNLPVRRIVFLETRKYDGTNIRRLQPAEVQQIAGRAGRKGMYNEGLYTSEHEKDFIRTAVSTSLPEISYIYIPFPESIIDRTEKVSDAIHQWNQIPYRGFAIPVQIDEWICKELECFTNDKNLIWTFLNIPFNERNNRQKGFWKKLFFLQVFHGDKVEEYLEALIPCYEDDYELNELEELSHDADILYAYMRKFGYRKYIEKVSVERQKINAAIIQILRTKKLPVRKCHTCGQMLPWNYPYGLCEDCYHQEMRNVWF